MMHLAVFALAYSGLAAICFGSRRRRTEALSFEAGPFLSPALKCLGAASLATALGAAVATSHHIGIVEWIGAVGTAGVALIILVALSPRTAIALAAGAMIIGATGAAIILAAA